MRRLRSLNVPVTLVSLLASRWADWADVGSLELDKRIDVFGSVEQSLAVAEVGIGRFGRAQSSQQFLLLVDTGDDQRAVPVIASVLHAAGQVISRIEAGQVISRIEGVPRVLGVLTAADTLSGAEFRWETLRSSSLQRPPHPSDDVVFVGKAVPLHDGAVGDGDVGGADAHRGRF